MWELMSNYWGIELMVGNFRVDCVCCICVPGGNSVDVEIESEKGRGGEKVCGPNAE